MSPQTILKITIKRNQMIKQETSNKTRDKREKIKSHKNYSYNDRKLNKNKVEVEKSQRVFHELQFKTKKKLASKNHI